MSDASVSLRDLRLLSALLEKHIKKIRKAMERFPVPPGHLDANADRLENAENLQVKLTAMIDLAISRMDS